MSSIDGPFGFCMVCVLIANLQTHVFSAPWHSMRRDEGLTIDPPSHQPKRTQGTQEGGGKERDGVAVTVEGITVHSAPPRINQPAAKPSSN